MRRCDGFGDVSHGREVIRAERVERDDVAADRFRDGLDAVLRELGLNEKSPDAVRFGETDDFGELGGGGLFASHFYGDLFEAVCVAKITERGVIDQDHLASVGHEQGVEFLVESY